MITGEQREMRDHRLAFSPQMREIGRQWQVEGAPAATLLVAGAFSGAVGEALVLKKRNK